MQKVLTIRESTSGSNHPDTAGTSINLAALLVDMKRFDAAEPLIRRALQIEKNSFGPHNTNVAGDLNNVGELLKDTNRFSEAEPLLQKVLAIYNEILGPDHFLTKVTQENLEELKNRMSEPTSDVRKGKSDEARTKPL